MDRERRRDVLLGREQAGQIAVDLTDQAVRARRGYPVTPRIGRRRPDEVIPFLYREHEERVVLVDAGGGQTSKELPERLVVVLQLLDVVGLTRAPGRVDLSGDAVLIMGVGDVAERHGYPGFLHLGDVREGGGREQAVESGEADLPELVADRVPVEIVHRWAAIGDRRIHVLRPEQPEEAAVAFRLIGQAVGPSMLVAGADAPALRAVDGEADEVSLRQIARRRPRWRGIGRHRLVP